MSTVTEIKEAVARLPKREKIQFARWMQAQVSDQLSDNEMMAVAAEGARALDRREAQHAKPLPELEAALRCALRSPRKKYKPGHFTALASCNGRHGIVE